MSNVVIIEAATLPVCPYFILVTETFVLVCALWFQGDFLKLTRHLQEKSYLHWLPLPGFPWLARDSLPGELPPASPDGVKCSLTQSTMQESHKVFSFSNQPTLDCLLSPTCSDWESWTKSLCTVWLVSSWERRLITWLRISKHCCCRDAWQKNISDFWWLYSFTTKADSWSDTDHSWNRSGSLTGEIQYI